MRRHFAARFISPSANVGEIGRVRSPLLQPDGPDVTDDELRKLCSDLARENELLHARVVEMTNLAEEAVGLRVEAELAREAAEEQLRLLLQTRSMRWVQPLRRLYGRVRRYFGRAGA